MCQKADDLATKMGQKEFVSIDGWFHHWRKQENIVFKQTYEEQKSADVEAADRWIEEEWPKLTASYALKDVCNADESGLYYRAMPSHTYLFNGESTKGHKVSKEHVTILCWVRMTGEKKQLSVTGKSKMPRCFKGIKKLPVDYIANKFA
ncbi:Tigger transposable element-derived protein 4 [Araneus ventricosus]|uniref:Tigger transposable element-derived protein 4 n=1 Tax=Araneus ventricosus TaxID=182803 RepID=A0A4Y2GSB9_ARAVE|nr:Tigger transposable element-derived protein 4 [Araneus ventricosus]